MKQFCVLGRGRLPWGIGLWVGLLMTMPTGCDALRRGLVTTDGPRPSARVINIHLTNLSLRGATLRFDVQVTNPYTVSLPVGAVAYDLASGSQSFLSGRVELNRAIPAGETESFSLPATVKFAELLEVLTQVKPGAVLPYEADLRLSAQSPGLGRIELPLRTSGELPIPSVPSVELSRVEWTDMSYTKAQAVLNFSITNTNQFPVMLSRMTYGLSLAGTPVAQAGLGRTISLQPGQGQGVRVPISVAPAKLKMAFFKMITGDGAGYKVAGTLELESPFGPMKLPYQKVGQTPFSR